MGSLPYASATGAARWPGTSDTPEHVGGFRGDSGLPSLSRRSIGVDRRRVLRLPGAGEPAGVQLADQGNLHIASADSPHVPYNSDPPTSGPHLPYIAPWGVHTRPIAASSRFTTWKDGGRPRAVQLRCPDLVAKAQAIVQRTTSSHSRAVSRHEAQDRADGVDADRHARAFDEARVTRFHRDLSWHRPPQVAGRSRPAPCRATRDVGRLHGPRHNGSPARRLLRALRVAARAAPYQARSRRATTRPGRARAPRSPGKTCRCARLRRDSGVIVRRLHRADRRLRRLRPDWRRSSRGRGAGAFTLFAEPNGTWTRVQVNSKMRDAHAAQGLERQVASGARLPVRVDRPVRGEPARRGARAGEGIAVPSRLADLIRKARRSRRSGPAHRGPRRRVDSRAPRTRSLADRPHELWGRGSSRTPCGAAGSRAKGSGRPSMASRGAGSHRTRSGEGRGRAR